MAGPAIMAPMYIIAIGWLYVIFMMALTEASIVAGVATFFFYGLLPTALILYLGGSKVRRQRRAWQELQEAKRQEALAGQPSASGVAGDQLPGQPDGKDTQADQ